MTALRVFLRTRLDGAGMRAPRAHAGDHDSSDA